MDLRPNLQGVLPPLAEKYVRELSIQVSQLQGQVQDLDASGKDLADAVNIIRHPTATLIAGGGGGPTLGIYGPSEVSVTHDVVTIDGLVWFYVNYNYISPVSDPNFIATCIDAMWVDPFTGDEVGQRYFRIYEEGQQGPYTSEAYKAYDGGRRKYRFYCRFIGQTITADTPDSEIPGLVIVIAEREPLALGMPGGGDPEPVDPSLSNWSIANPSSGSGDYVVDNLLVPRVRLQPTLISLPTDANYLAFWVDRGVGTGWEYLTSIYSPATYIVWQEQPKTTTTWKICAVAGNDSWYNPPPTGVVYRTITLLDWLIPPAITGVSVTHADYSVDGVVYFDVTINYTAPVTDLNWYATAIDAEWVDPITGADVPGVTKWERIYWERKQGPWIIKQIKAYDGGRRKYRIYNIPMAFSDRFGDTFERMGLSGVIYLADREPLATGFDLSAADPARFGPGIYMDPSSGSIQTTSNDFLNGSFEFGMKDWNILGGAAFTTDGYDGNHACVMTANGAEQYIWQYRSCNPGQFFRLQGMSKQTSIAGPAPQSQLAFFFANGTPCPGGDGVGYFNQTRPLGTNAFQSNILVWGEAPVNSAFVFILPMWLPSTTSGNITVDMIKLGVYEPGSDEVTRDPATGRIGFAAGALGKMDKYPSYARPVLNGPTDPTSDTTAIASATNGSYYINTTSRKIFKRVGSTWTNVEAADVVAGGTFIGNALSLTANGIAANVLSASDGAAGPLSGYFGLSVEYTPAGQYKAVVSPDAIWMYNKDFATIPNFNSGIIQNAIACNYGKNSVNPICSQLQSFGTQSGGVTTYAYGRVLVYNINGGNSSSAGYFVDNLRVVRERQSVTIGTYVAPTVPYNNPGEITNFTQWDIVYAGSTGWHSRIHNEVEQLKTNLAQLRTALQTHGLTN